MSCIFLFDDNDDFVIVVLGKGVEKGLMKDEFEVNCILFLLVGSEIMMMLLLGVIYYLCENFVVLCWMMVEVRVIVIFEE